MNVVVKELNQKLSNHFTPRLFNLVNAFYEEEKSSAADEHMQHLHGKQQQYVVHDYGHTALDYRDHCSSWLSGWFLRFVLMRLFAVMIWAGQVSPGWS